MISVDSIEKALVDYAKTHSRQSLISWFRALGVSAPALEVTAERHIADCMRAAAPKVLEMLRQKLYQVYSESPEGAVMVLGADDPPQDESHMDFIARVSEGRTRMRKWCEAQVKEDIERLTLVANDTRRVPK